MILWIQEAHDRIVRLLDAVPLGVDSVAIKPNGPDAAGRRGHSRFDPVEESLPMWINP